MKRRRLFGTDGIRDVANQGNLTPEAVLRLGKVLGHLLATSPEILGGANVRSGLPSMPPPAPRLGEALPGTPFALVGRDTRVSGPLIESALVTGLLSRGIDVVSVGVLPTPSICYLTRKFRATIGVVISASHNPFQDNGIKVFSPSGFKIPDEAERQVESLMLSKRRFSPSSLPGRKVELARAADDYVDDLVESVPDGLSSGGLKVVLDCAHGAMHEVAPTVLGRLGAEVSVLNATPDGTNINQNCGALHPEGLARAVSDLGADLGVAFDGDGDRAIFVDEKGTIRDGDYVLAICGRFMKEKGLLANDTVVGTEMSNLGLEVSLNEAGIRLTRTPVGDRYVAEAMLSGGYVLGGEQSGHILFLERSTTGDGLVTALAVIEIMRQRREPMSRLCACLRKYPQLIRNVPADSRPHLARLKPFNEAVEKWRLRLGSRGRIVVRYSGTEPRLRIMVEARDQSDVERIAEEIAQAFINATSGRNSGR